MLVPWLHGAVKDQEEIPMATTQHATDAALTQNDDPTPTRANRPKRLGRGRRLALTAAALVALVAGVFGTQVAGAPAASALAITTYDPEPLVFSRYEPVVAWDGNIYWAEVWLTRTGAGAYYCWYYYGGCWWEGWGSANYGAPDPFEG
jgi:hypothetical protein